MVKRRQESNRVTEPCIAAHRGGVFQVEHRSAENRGDGEQKRKPCGGSVGEPSGEAGADRRTGARDAGDERGALTQTDDECVFRLETIAALAACDPGRRQKPDAGNAQRYPYHREVFEAGYDRVLEQQCGHHHGNRSQNEEPDEASTRCTQISRLPSREYEPDFAPQIEQHGAEGSEMQHDVER